MSAVSSNCIFYQLNVIHKIRFHFSIIILCSYHLFGLGDLKDVADVDSGVDWNWPWPWQIVHPRAVALKYT